MIRLTFIYVSFREHAFELLETALKELWDKFLNSISSGVSDYLSIEHLGLILERLAEQGKLLLCYTNIYNNK